MTWLLVRHAAAGDRHRWDGPDEERPLSPKGRRQAELLVPLLEPYGVTRLLSSPYVRCTETFEPLAAATGLDIEPRSELAEGASADATLSLLRDTSDGSVALCTHGDVVPEVLDGLADADGLDLPRRYPYEKGSVWVIDRHDGVADRATYLPPPV